MIDGRGRRRDDGFALVLAILSLMLLTFLGLTLATTTSTELQIATNYRWSQMALYNAEAGLEAARIMLSNSSDPAGGWDDILPERRTSPDIWDVGSAPGPLESTVGRDFELAGCDERGGLGYGLVLDDGTTRLEDTSTFMGETLNGAFTVWIRRPLRVSDEGQYSDATENTELVIASEGVAPFIGASTVFTRARQAVRVLETRYALIVAPGSAPCQGPMQGQEGMSPTGENFNPCAPLGEGGLGAAFGGAGAGSLGSNINVE